MTVYLAGLQRLGDATKGVAYVPDSFAVRVSGVAFPSFATIAANGLQSYLYKNGPGGTAVTITIPAVVDYPTATIIPFTISSTDTGNLDCERMYWTCYAKDGSNNLTPLCNGWIQVRPK